MAAQPARIDVLLRFTPDHPENVLHALESAPETASQQDEHGYSLLHAAASYGHIELMKTLVQQYKVDPNIKDEDGDTPLFYAEQIDVVRCLVTELGTDLNLKNDDGITALEKIQEEGEGTWAQEAVAFLSGSTINENGPPDASGATNGTAGQPVDVSTLLARPPMVPDNLQVNLGTMQELEGVAPDPELRRRIEELVARGNFDGEEGQRELRDLVTDVVAGMREDEPRDAQRRRLGE